MAAAIMAGASWIPNLANSQFNTVLLFGVVNALLLRWFDVRFVGFGKKISLSAAATAALEQVNKKDETALPQDGKLSILSQNVWCHYGQQWYAPSAKKRLDCLQAEIVRRKYDIVMLQELFMLRFGPFAITSNFERFVAELTQHGYHSITDPRSSLPFLGQNSGLVILARLPLRTRSTEHVFEKTGEKVCVKGFVHAELLLGDNTTLNVVTTHLDSKNKPKNVQGSQSLQIRNTVLDAVLDRDPNAPILVGGDWNVCSRKSKDQGEAYALLQQNMAPLRDAFGGIFGEAELAPTRRPDTKPWVRGKKKGKEGGAAIDHAFFSGMECTRADLVDLRCSDSTVVSDHLGMLLEVVVPSRKK